MDMRTRKLHQGLSYSDVEKAGVAWEKARVKYPSRHPMVEALGQRFTRKWKQFQSNSRVSLQRVRDRRLFCKTEQNVGNS